jgi:hypothetical protein
MTIAMITTRPAKWITRSALCGETIRIGKDANVQNLERWELAELSEGTADSRSETGEFEFWGTLDDGRTWRVHLEMDV